MKMVSAAKYTRAERELKAVRPIGSGASQFYEKAEVQPVAEVPQKLVIAMTSDRGKYTILSCINCIIFCLMRFNSILILISVITKSSGAQNLHICKKKMSN